MNRYERFADVLKRKELGEGIRVGTESNSTKEESFETATRSSVGLRCNLTLIASEFFHPPPTYPTSGGRSLRLCRLDDS
jgi:hypothetical protein